jgi:hypothetical protein
LVTLTAVRVPFEVGLVSGDAKTSIAITPATIPSMM